MSDLPPQADETPTQIEQVSDSPETPETTPKTSEQEELARADLRALFGNEKPPLPEVPAIADLTNATEAAVPVDESPLEIIPEVTEPEPPPIIYQYRVAMVLLTELESQIQAARQAVGMETASIGLFTLLPDFQTEDLPALQTALGNWAKTHLPITVTVERVEALVEGSQRYLAGLALEPQNTLENLHTTLTEALTPLLQTPAESLPFRARLPVADHIAAASFPKLVHHLQQHFKPLDWQINAVELLRVPQGDSRWEVVEKITATAS